MKTFSALLFCVLASTTFAQQNFGDTITTTGAMGGHDFGHAIAHYDSLDAKVLGVVSTVCQVKGCWMTMDLGHGLNMRITFKDYGFFVPKDCAGQTAVVEGTAYKKLVSVEEQRHFAEDEGRSAEEIAAITQPKMELRFIAEGVLLL